MRRATHGVVVAGLLLLVGARPGSAVVMNVLAGSDYMVTQPGTEFAGVPFEGVPFGPGGSDTIIQRLDNVDVTSGPGITPTVLSGLELQTTAPVNFGLGTGIYYVTLQSVRGGPASTGTLDITQTSPDDNTSANPEGTFDASFDVFFDLRFGSLTGPIALSSDLMLSSTGNLWDADPSPTDIVVTGPRGDLAANEHTGKIRNVDIYDMDFFPVGVITETDGEDTHKVVSPEPGTLLLVGAGLVLLVGRGRRA